MYVPEEVDRVLFTEDEIKAKIAELGEKLTREYEGKNPLFICVLKGAVVFFSDLIREIKCPMEINFLRASSYGNSTVSSGDVKLSVGEGIIIKDRDVVLVEDILDSGKTLNYITQVLKTRNPASIRICTLLDKPERREADIKADYFGAFVPDEFVVGYGLDFAEKYRNLPYIGVLKPEIYSTDKE